MIDYVRSRKPARVLLVTECSMAIIPPPKQRRRSGSPLQFCPHMKRITLPKILDSLIYMRDEVLVDQALAARARASVQRMIDVG